MTYKLTEMPQSFVKLLKNLFSKEFGVVYWLTLRLGVPEVYSSNHGLGVRAKRKDPFFIISSISGLDKDSQARVAQLVERWPGVP